MHGHWIRLRGGWEYCRVDSPGVPERITLPTRWASEQPGRGRLTRRFGCPPLDAGRQVLVLSLQQVPGIHSIRLNQLEIPRVSPDRSSYEIPLDSLPPRNVLVLEVESSLAHGRTDAEAPKEVRRAPTGDVSLWSSELARIAKLRAEPV